MSALTRDEELERYATPRQWEIELAYWDAGTQPAAAEILGISQSRVSGALRAIRRRAASQGYAPEHDLTHPIPDGFRLRGASSLYKKGEPAPLLTWVKTTRDLDRQEELLVEMVAGLSGELAAVSPIPGPEPEQHMDELLAVYPVGDHHLGMRAWREDSGGEYNLEISERLLAQAFGSLTASLPPAGSALIVFLGDLFHFDTMEPVTPAHKNQLDADGRYGEMVRAGVRLVRRSIEYTLARHPRVTVIVQAGNHDPSSSLLLAECLYAMYELEPRVTIDRSPRMYHYYEHGANLIGVCHGHEVKKLDSLPLIMAHDRQEAWARTKHRLWLTGHVHHDRTLDVHGTRIESFRILAPTDAYANMRGYRGHQEMKAILLHARHGEVQRVSVNPGMFAGDDDD